MAILPGCSVTRDWFYDRRYKTGKIPGPYTGISMARNSIYKYRGYQPNDSRLVPPLIIRDVVPFLFPSPYSLLIPSSSFFYFHHEWTSDEIRSNHSILEIQNPLFHSSQFFDYQLKKNWSTCKFFEKSILKNRVENQLRNPKTERIPLFYFTDVTIFVSR